MVVTLAERKKARVEAMRGSLDRLRNELSDYARRHGGRFWLYGSAASGQLRYDSDIDILADFERDALTAAVVFAEDACVRLGLKPDVKPKSWCTDAFLQRIAAKAQVLA